MNKKQSREKGGREWVGISVKKNSMSRAQKNMMQVGVGSGTKFTVLGALLLFGIQHSLSGWGQLHKGSLHANNASACSGPYVLIIWAPTSGISLSFIIFSRPFCTSFLSITLLTNSVHVASHLNTYLYSDQEIKKSRKANLAGNRSVWQ